MNVNLKLSGLYSSLFVIRFSLIFQKYFWWWGGDLNRKEPSLFYCKIFFDFSKKIDGGVGTIKKLRFRKSNIAITGIYWEVLQ